MAKKIRKPAGGKRSTPPQGNSAVDASDDALEEAGIGEATSVEDESSAAKSPSVLVRPTTPGASPLVRSQEVELEVGLTLMAAVLGALSGYSQAPMDAPTGNMVAGVMGALVGAMMGYSLARTLFLSVRQQWIAWFVVVALAAGPGAFLGLPGALAGAIAGLCLVIFGQLTREEESATT